MHTPTDALTRPPSLRKKSNKWGVALTFGILLARDSERPSRASGSELGLKKLSDSKIMRTCERECVCVCERKVTAHAWAHICAGKTMLHLLPGARFSTVRFFAALRRRAHCIAKCMSMCERVRTVVGPRACVHACSRVRSQGTTWRAHRIWVCVCV